MNIYCMNLFLYVCHVVPVDCVDPLCSSHGSCVGGKCYCKAGWQGVNCSVVDQQVYQCLPGCSEHGSYDLEMGACICENYWSGTDCSQGEFNTSIGMSGCKLK
uniref:EGF-like domain-containing protein n=1 Tax=Timema bartmani TaxID=61472 RepID=A0A7R9ELV7_9NEOP|nr:unnamed protein product [Timema bartmani]